MKNKKGISLIVLIITIIVVIILAAIIIITLTKNNPVDSAKEATFKQDVRNFQDELSMYIGNENIKDIQGNREKITTVDMPSVKVMKEYIESFSSKYENKLGIYKDELVYYKPDNEVKNKVTDKEEKWLQDLGINLYENYIKEADTQIFLWSDSQKTCLSGIADLEKFNTYLKENNYILKLPERCRIIEKKAFYNQSGIVKMIIPEGVTKLESCAISDCNDIETIEIPSTVNYIDRAWTDYGNSFCGCSKLRSINVNDNNSYYSSEDGVLFDKEKTILYKFKR